MMNALSVQKANSKALLFQLHVMRCLLNALAKLCLRLNESGKGNDSKNTAETDE